jgi:branched-chain amino acid transport system substrate-binding protein
MIRSTDRSHGKSRRRAASCLAVGALAMLAASCSSDSSAAPTTTAPATTMPVTTMTGATTATTTAATGGSTTSAAVTTTTPANNDPTTAFATLAPPTGPQIVMGLVNTEGAPGLDFPDIRIDIQAAVDYLNQHGGLGGRPIKIENCTAKGSPESSQSCAQELVGKKVEMVLTGLDLFPAYATYTAAKIPVVGVLPILPGDYTAKALFLTGGNATTMAAVATVARDTFHAKKIGIVSADNPGANGTEAALTASLDKAGIAHTTVKGGDNETDAGYQGLMREVTKNNPDLLVSLYSDAGCIGTMRGRASLNITTPVITTGICSAKDVIDAVGDDAIGWTFVGVNADQTTPQQQIMHEIMAPSLKVSPDKVDSTALGLGALGIFEIMSLAVYGDMMQTAGKKVDGPSLYSFLETSKNLTLWPGGAPIACGSAAKYPSVCSFNFPFAEYQKGGKVVPVKGLESVSSKELLP